MVHQTENWERKLSNIMKIMKEKGDLDKDKRLTNHSARKYLVQKLRKNDIQNTDIMQISGHKSVTSVNNYSSMDEDKHRKISNILSNPTENVPNVADLSTTSSTVSTLPELHVPSLNVPLSDPQPTFSSQTNMNSRVKYLLLYVVFVESTVLPIAE
ncbi:unnamed protein product [Mytilus edulis]|uniref:Tyr recombinase domain-containing protein n=1 Tax=Mytilus edulis TaxID=6550 RepID=A0A8S3R8L2_MYTED|nr:unnamed protein product [Mytilus edulis]